MNILWLLLGGVAVYFVYKKFSGGGANYSGGLPTATTGTAGSGFQSFYPGWRQVPTPSSPRPSSVPQTITAVANGVSGLVGSLRNLFGGNERAVTLSSSDLTTVYREPSYDFSNLESDMMDIYGSEF